VPIIRRVLIPFVVLLLCACSSVSPTDRAAAPHVDGRPTEAIESRPPDPSTPSVDAAIPPPDEPIPRSPDRLADALATTTFALRDAIDGWAAGVGLSAPPPRDVRLLAFHQQRLYWALTEDPDLARLTVPRLPANLAGEARANIEAGADIRSLVTPIEGEITLRTQRPEPAEDLLAYYREAEERFGVEWEVLAAVNYVESRFGRARSASPAGAQGPMQFLPGTWRAYGLGGDILDPHDAILGAANFLSSGGAPRRYRRALYYYNHAWPYVDAVLLYARQMMRDPRDYLVYYNWPVVVLTTDGPEHLTGPGSA
jgi:soluble lytic murein transglycosylase-like protein